MLQGIIIDFPVTMTFEYLEDHPKLGKIIVCDHKGYRINNSGVSHRKQKFKKIRFINHQQTE